MIKESIGHIRFWGNYEYIDVNGQLLEAPWKNGIDPSGMRYGALSSHSLKSKEELICHLKDCVRKDRDLFPKFIPDQEKHLYPLEPEPEPGPDERILEDDYPVFTEYLYLGVKSFPIRNQRKCR